MLKKFYYKIAEIKFKHQINYLGRNSQLRLNGRVIEGKYVHLESDVHIEKKLDNSCVSQIWRKE